MSTNVINKSNYCQKRLNELGIADKDNILTVRFNDNTEERQFFTSDDNDNIIIHYFSLDSLTEKYKKGRWSEEYKRTRVNPLNIKDAKYLSPFGSTSRFFWPKLLIESYQSKTEIHTLVVTEGEFKAFKACLHGIYCAGIAGIHNFKDKDTGQLHPEFIKLLEVCNVKNILFLLDADCISERYIEKAISEGKDLFNRLAGFYTAVKTFKELTRNLTDIGIYFGNIKSKFESNGKGLDDLICFSSNKEHEIKKDIERLAGATDYFDIYELSKDYKTLLLKKFLLNLDRRIYPIEFHEKFEAIIGTQEFIFNGCKFQMQNDSLKLTYHPEVFKYMRVGSDYYKISYTVGVDKRRELIIKAWKKSEIVVDIPFIPSNTLFQLIPRYETFVNVPDNSVNYKRIIDNCYNIYEPLNYNPIKGNFPITEKFLTHIFKEYYEIALDYFTIMYRYPAQKLPAICLVSKERNTGKSTFFKWVAKMFQNNAIILSNADFSEKFNSYFAGKLAICIDETFINKKEMAEHLKKLITDDFIMLHPKGKEAYKIPFFAKFMLNSNNERDFLQIDEAENRYFVLKVDEIQKSKEIPDLIIPLEEELPQFFHFLQTRQIKYEHKTRFWFDYDIYKTKALKNVVSHSRSKLEKALIDWFEDMFNHIQEDFIECTPTLLKYELEDRFNKYNDLKGEIKRVLRDNWNLTTSEQKKFTFYCLTEKAENNSNNSFEYDLLRSTRNGTPYKVDREFIKSLC